MSVSMLREDGARRLLFILLHAYLGGGHEHERDGDEGVQGEAGGQGHAVRVRGAARQHHQHLVFDGMGGWMRSGLMVWIDGWWMWDQRPRVQLLFLVTNVLNAKTIGKARQSTTTCEV